MKRAFVRGLWGIHGHTGRYYQRRSKMDADISFLKKVKYNEPFICYAFGNDNYKFLKSEGFNCKQISKEPILWDMNTQQFRHKLEIFRAAMEDYDQIVFLDWDTIPTKKIPQNFWETLEAKGDFQAILRMYHRTKAFWRTEDRRKIPCASFVYIGNKKIPNRLIQIWEEIGKPWSEEVVMARYMEEVMGGWKGLVEYWNRFEPDFFVLGEGQVFSRQQLASKNKCFEHINSTTRNKILRRRHKPEWIKIR